MGIQSHLSPKGDGVHQRVSCACPFKVSENVDAQLIRDMQQINENPVLFQLVHFTAIHIDHAKFTFCIAGGRAMQPPVGLAVKFGHPKKPL